MRTAALVALCALGGIGGSACSGAISDSPAGSGSSAHKGGARDNTAELERSEPGGAKATAGAASVCAGLTDEGEADAPPGEARIARDAEAGARELASGLELMKTTEHPAAAAAFARAITADPFLGLAYLEGAETHLYTDNDAQEIKRLLVRALELLPANPRAHLRFGEVLHELGDNKLAEAHWRCALELRGDLIDARRQLGALLLATGRVEEAVRELQVAAEQEPDELQTQVVLANALEASGKTLDAAKAVEGAARIAGKSAALYRRAGQLYEVAGSFVAAKRVRALADRLDPPKKERQLRPLKKARKR
jgi:tetratricopeptide (TPR) repeat protein